jgi:putative flippase GtrA
MHKLMIYLFIGVLNTILCFVVMGIGDWLGFHYSTYTAVGYIISMFFSFFMNLWFTFKVQGLIFKRLMIFLVINGINLILVEWIQYTLIERFHWADWPAIIFAMVVYIIIGYIMNQYIVYRHRGVKSQ